MLAATTNYYLIILAGIGWLLSLYFGFFRYRQFVWSRNKVRFDLLLKVDQRRAELSAKMLLLAGLKPDGKRVGARIQSLLRRYFETLLQIEFFHSEGAIDEAIIDHLNRGVRNDLEELFAKQPELRDLLESWTVDRATTDGFISRLLLTDSPAKNLL